MTILPRSTGTSVAWSEIVASVTKLLRSRQGTVDRELERKDVEPKQKDEETRLSFISMLQKRLGADGIEHTNAFKSTPGHAQPHRDRTFFHWLLVRETNIVWHDAQLSETKEYSYDEWKYFLRLLGHDEHKPELHRWPNPRPARGPEDEPQIGRPIDKHGRIRPWSWMGFRSPLMSPKEDASWVLQQLMARLQREMEKLAMAPDGVDTVPVSLDMLLDNDAASILTGGSRMSGREQA